MSESDQTPVSRLARMVRPQFAPDSDTPLTDAVTEAMWDSEEATGMKWVVPVEFAREKERVVARAINLLGRAQEEIRTLQRARELLEAELMALRRQIREGEQS